MIYRTIFSQTGIRRLWKSDQLKLVDHFQRLDKHTRHLRFGGTVSDSFLTEYAETILSTDYVNFGAFPDGELRGVAELRGLLDSWPRSAEIALVVEPAWQDRGIGEAMFNRLLAAAQKRGIKKLNMLCLHENIRMRNLVRKHDAHLKIESGNIEATLGMAWPTPISIFDEVFSDPRGYLPAPFRTSSRQKGQ
ncbi:GNAT family N-acetyltransferase [Labrenzia sp. PHM005]|nr:GNAT family N-acetyltransferase [Labrenzia sp. PHM005]